LSANLHDLGNSVVFDAEKLQVGNHVKMDGIVLIVSKIEGERVFVQPVVGADLLMYRIKQYRLWIGLAVAATIGLVVLYGKGII